jgi:hypothetical protein
MDAHYIIAVHLYEKCTKIEKSYFSMEADIVQLTNGIRIRVYFETKESIDLCCIV